MQGMHIPDTGHDMPLASACLHGEAVLCAPTRTNMEHCHSTWTWKAQRARTARKTGKASITKRLKIPKRTQPCHTKKSAPESCRKNDNNHGRKNGP